MRTYLQERWEVAKERLLYVSLGIGIILMLLVAAKIAGFE
jgi:hypothetical protein